MSRFLDRCIAFFSGRVLWCVLFLDYLVMTVCFTAMRVVEVERRFESIDVSQTFWQSAVVALALVAVTSVVGVVGGMLYLLRTGRFGALRTSRYSGQDRSIGEILHRSTAIAWTIVAGSLVWAVISMD